MELFFYCRLQSIDDDVDSLRSRSDLTNTANTTNGVSAWGSAFEKLLEDPAGLHTFAEFLKKEFSAENIYFWTSCERYRQLDDAERSREAIQIFSKHLGVGAPEPVNVDSQARTTAQEHLQKAEKDLFMQVLFILYNVFKSHRERSEVKKNFHFLSVGSKTDFQLDEIR